MTLAALQLPSCHFRPRVAAVKYIVLHGTWMRSDAEALKLLRGQGEAEVSVHYMVDQQGTLIQCVAEECVAYHAGVSAWRDDEKLNETSIGIEVSNPGEGEGVPYHEVQYHTVARLLKQLIEKYNLPLENVLAHSDIAPTRKDDPGIHFPWRRLEQEGLAAPAPFVGQPTLELMQQYGYRGTDVQALHAAYTRRFLGEN